MIGKLTLLLLVVAFANANPALGKHNGWISSLRRHASHVDHDGGDANIVGGTEAVPHSFPFQVYVDIGVLTCGGVLISDEWVLTSADCVSGGRSFKVVMGAHNIAEEEPTQVILTGTEYFVPDTYTGDFTDDIGLIKLPEKVTFDDNIQPAKLPSQALEQESCIATGWGLVDEDGYLYSDVLMQGDANVVTLGFCNSFYSMSLENVICVDPRNEGAAFCDGDFGGPLHTDGIVHGVAIFYASAGCQSGGPQGYTEVFQQLAWIEEVSGVVP